MFLHKINILSRTLVVVIVEAVVLEVLFLAELKNIVRLVKKGLQTAVRAYRSIFRQFHSAYIAYHKLSSLKKAGVQ